MSMELDSVWKAVGQFTVLMIVLAIIMWMVGDLDIHISGI